MTRFTWDTSGNRKTHGGVDRGVLLPSLELLGSAAPWNGLTNVDVRNERSDTSRPIYLYGAMARSVTPSLPALSVTAYTYPDVLDTFINAGLSVDFSFRSKVLNDLGEIKHIIHYFPNCIFTSSSVSYGSLSNIFNNVSLKWDVVLDGWGLSELMGLPGLPTKYYKFSESLLSTANYTRLENIIYGSSTTAPRALMPSDLTGLIGM